MRYINRYSMVAVFITVGITLAMIHYNKSFASAETTLKYDSHESLDNDFACQIDRIMAQQDVLIEHESGI